MFQVKRVEYERVLLTLLMIMAHAYGYAIGWTAVHTLLVKRMGIEYLPYIYIILSASGVVGSLIYLFFADKVRRDTLLIWFALLTGGAILFSFFFVTDQDFMAQKLGFSLHLEIFFIIITTAQGLGNSTLITQVWTVINDLFTPEQGRRTFPIIGSATAIGGILGGISIKLLIPLVGITHLLIAWSASVLVIIPLCLRIRL